LGDFVTDINICDHLHKRVQGLRRFNFGDQSDDLPLDGVYFVFERGQQGHGGSRIVMIGSHRGNGKLAARLREHTTQNKDRSIFRKQIGRALLNRNQDPFLADWNQDLTTRKNKELHFHRISKSKLATVEEEVSKFISDYLSFAVINCDSPAEALKLQKLFIGTVSNCSTCSPTSDWFGHSSPDIKISESGLWQVMGLYKAGLQEDDLQRFYRSD
jgi:hypothetical protein